MRPAQSRCQAARTSVPHPGRIGPTVKVFGDELRRWYSGHPKGRLDKRGHAEDVWCPSCCRYQTIHKFIVWMTDDRGLSFTQMPRLRRDAPNLETTARDGL